MRRLVVLCALALAAPVAGRAQTPPSVVAGPQSQSVGFATPVAIVSASQGALFVNFDAVVHNVVSTATGSESNAWCGKFPHTRGACPLFRSADLGNQQSGEIFGVSALSPGQTYTFTCIYHGAMKGTLVVLP